MLRWTRTQLTACVHSKCSIPCRAMEPSSLLCFLTCAVSALQLSRKLIHCHHVIDRICNTIDTGTAKLACTVLHLNIIRATLCMAFHGKCAPICGWLMITTHTDSLCVQLSSREGLRDQSQWTCLQTRRKGKQYLCCCSQGACAERYTEHSN